MNKVEFKVGDLVYYPNISNKIGKIVGTSVIANDPCCLKVDIDETVIFVTKDGKFVVNAPMPVIYHATKENYEWLSATYPSVAFEPPPSKEPKEIIQAMLDSGKKYVICWVSDCYENPDESDQLAAIQEILTYTTDRPFIDETDSSWAYATPFDTDTGKVIVDYVNGEVVLED